MEHPLIGAWTITTEGMRKPGPDYATASFHADGSLTITMSGYTAHGAWRALDSGRARFRALAPVGPGEGQAGWHTFVFDVAHDSGTGALSLDGTYERPTPSGSPLVAHLTGAGERLLVDPDA